MGTAMFFPGCAALVVLALVTALGPLVARYLP